MVAARYLVGDVFDRLAELDDGSVDVVITSPPFLALRSYLPADHPDKSREIGSESSPAEFIDTLLKVTAELRRVLAPHGSLCVELGDTYARSGGGGGDYLDGGWREGQQQFAGSQASMRESNAAHWRQKNRNIEAWPQAKSLSLIPESYRFALAYGFNPHTGQESPAGKWRIRNVIRWVRPNPPVGALGDKWRPATSEIVVACVSGKRYWDDLATRRPADPTNKRPSVLSRNGIPGRTDQVMYPLDEDGQRIIANAAGAPLLDWWELPPTGYSGSHYAVYPPELVRPLIKAMCPEKVCLTCGEPSRRIVATEYARSNGGTSGKRRDLVDIDGRMKGNSMQGKPTMDRLDSTLGFTDCGHDNYRPGIVLDPFAGTGTTGLVAVQEGRDAILIDLDERNAVLAEERIGVSLLHSFEVAR